MITITLLNSGRPDEVHREMMQHVPELSCDNLRYHQKLIEQVESLCALQAELSVF